MKKIVEYLPLLSICLLYFGFCNLYYYYREFNIEIYSFITSTDILLSFFPKIVLFTSVIYSAIFAQLYNTLKQPVEQKVTEPKTVEQEEVEPKVSNVPVHSKVKKTRLEWWRSNIESFVVLYYLPILLISLLLRKLFHLKPYELSDLNMIFDFLFLALIYFAIIIHKNRNSIFQRPILLALFLIVFIGQKIGSYRIFEAQKLKDGKSEYKKDHLSFKYKDSLTTTNDSLLFVGETATHIFIYNLKDSTTKVYPFSTIEDLKIK